MDDADADDDANNSDDADDADDADAEADDSDANSHGFRFLANITQRTPIPIFECTRVAGAKALLLCS